MGEEQDDVDDEESQAAGIHLPAALVHGHVSSGLVGGHSDARSNEQHEAHHDEGKEFADGVEDAEHHEGHQEARVLENVTI